LSCPAQSGDPAPEEFPPCASFAIRKSREPLDELLRLIRALQKEIDDGIRNLGGFNNCRVDSNFDFKSGYFLDHPLKFPREVAQCLRPKFSGEDDEKTGS
jgi:hypothetical protein